MSNEKFRHQGSRLGRFIEECGESLAAAGKCVRFGLDSVNPLLPPAEQETNEEWLRREMVDLKEAIQDLEEYLDAHPAIGCGE